MTPKVAASGWSFVGAGQYYLHDKEPSVVDELLGEKPTTSERVLWTHCENMFTKNAKTAMKVMAWTAMHRDELKKAAGYRAGRELRVGPVFSFSLAWDPEQNPTKDEMLSAARSAVKDLKLHTHEYVVVAHDDTAHKHVHVILNRIHPETGLAGNIYKSQEHLSKWALAYEKEHGKIYCQQRETNIRAREQHVRQNAQIKAKNRPIKEENARRKRENTKRKRQGLELLPMLGLHPLLPYQRHGNDRVVITAWERSDNGRTFIAALEEHGYALAAGRTGYVVVDRYGKARNPTRDLDGVRKKDFAAKVTDVPLSSLPKAIDVQKQVETKRREWRAYYNSRRHDRDRGSAIIGLRNRQFDERAVLEQRHRQQIETKAQELHAFYKIETLDRDIRHLEGQLAVPRSDLRKVFEKPAALTQQLQEFRAQRAEADRLITQQLRPLDLARAVALAEQEHVHALAMKQLEANLQHQQPEIYRDPVNRALERDGPSPSPF